MNLTRHKDFYELRFLLHGSREHYKNEQALYTTTSTENSVWENVTSKVFEPWRIIPISLTKNIPLLLWDSLNIQEIKPENIIAELSPELITASDFKSSQEIEIILEKICLDKKDRQQLWKGLALHEDVNGNFVSIDNQTYLENPKFNFDRSFQGIITLIKRSDTRQQKLALQQGWITKWTPQTAIAVALNQPQPQRFCSMLLNLLDEADEDLLAKLKQAKWLPLDSKGVIAPKNVVLLPAHLSKELGRGLEKVFRDEESRKYVSLSMLSSQVRDAKSLAKVCSGWKHETNILQYLLKETANPSIYCDLILKTLKYLVQRNQTIGKDNVQSLQNTAWILDCNKKAIKPEQIIYFPQLENEVTEILEKAKTWCNYITPKMLKLDINFIDKSSDLLSLFRTNEEAIKAFGEVVYILPEYHIGDFNQQQIDLEKFLQFFNDFNDMPVFRLAQKIPKEARKYILSQALQPIDSERLVKIFQWIAKTYETPSEDAIAIYNQYLELACRDVQKFGQEILPHITLLNQNAKWRLVKELCDGTKYLDIDNEYLLNTEQYEILSSYLKNVSSFSEYSDTLNFVEHRNSDYKNNAQILDEYFRPWSFYVRSELIGGFLCLVAGTDIEIQEISKTYLRNRNFDDLRERFLWSQDLREKNFNIYIQPINNKSKSVYNLIGHEFEAQICIKSLPKYIFSEIDSNPKELKLVQFPLESVSEKLKLETLLLESARLLVKKVYKTEVLETIDAIWEDLNTSKQLDVQVANNFMLKDLPSILKMLGVQNSEITGYLRQLWDADMELSELERRNSSDSKVIAKVREINNKITDIKQKIKNSIETRKDISHSILQGVRRKIGQGHYGYSASSIPFELFQNADDSLAELTKMLGYNTPARLCYHLAWDTTYLTIIYWGRPINLFVHPEVRGKDFKRQGFHQDLVKMLYFNISDKSESETGKFGLGFKTVHLISQEPKVISGDLNFAVHAGLLPVALPRSDREEDWELLQRLRNRLKSEQPSPDITDGTLIHLEIDPETNTNVNDIVNEFESKIGLLLVFAKFVKTCKLMGPSSPKEPLEWNPALKDVLGISGIEFGQVKIPQTRQEVREWITHNLLCFRIQEASFAIVLPEKLSLESSPLLELPTFWVIAPTKEELRLGFVINAKFDVTTGRTSLDRNSKHNQELAKAIGEGLGEKLCELFNKSQGNWETLRQSLKLKDINEYTFWEFFWNVLAVDWLKKSGEQTTMQIVETALGGKDRGIGYLILNHAALPNGLYGNYRQLVQSKDIKYIVKGILTKKEYFEKVITWQKFQQNCPSKCVIQHTIWQYVEKLIETTFNSPKPLCFAEALVWELGNKQISPKTASALGEIVTSDFVKSLQTTHRDEYDRINSELQNVYFESEDNGRYILASKLLIKGTSREEETLLAAFAPNYRLLHRDYVGNSLSLKFFRACREQRETIAPNEIVHWAIAADTDAKKQAVRQYLGLGTQKQTFASELRNRITGTWMENDLGIQEILKANSQQEQIEQAIEGKISWNEVVVNLSSKENNDNNNCKETKEHPDKNKILMSIYQWWKENYDAELKRYNERLYPIDDINELKQRLQDRDRSAWLMLFFLGATHTMGRTKHEQHRDFIKHCLQKNWWKTFSASNPKALHKEWMNVLNEYLEPQSDKTKWNYWMEKFPTIYRISRYLDFYINSFYSVEKIQNEFDLGHITAPLTYSSFQGGGPDAPPLPIGIGANFILRELMRLEILRPASDVYVSPHCFVPRANVRRMLMFLGCGGLTKSDYRSSANIYKFLQKEFSRLNLDGEPTFHNCFDIPFELYSEDSSKAKDLSLNEINVKEDYEFNEEEDS